MAKKGVAAEQDTAQKVGLRQLRIKIILLIEKYEVGRSKLHLFFTPKAFRQAISYYSQVTRNFHFTIPRDELLVLLINEYEDKYCFKNWLQIQKLYFTSKEDPYLLFDRYHNYLKLRNEKYDWTDHEAKLIEKYKLTWDVEAKANKEDERYSMKWKRKNYEEVRMPKELKQVQELINQEVESGRSYFVEIESKKREDVLIKYMESSKQIKRGALARYLTIYPWQWPCSYLKAKSGPNWTDSQDELLCQCGQQLLFSKDISGWAQFQSLFPQKTVQQIYFRRQLLDFQWSLEEEVQYLNLIQEFGLDWNKISQEMGLKHSLYEIKYKFHHFAHLARILDKPVIPEDKHKNYRKKMASQSSLNTPAKFML